MKLRNKKTGEIAELIEYGQEIVPHEIVEFVIETENNDYKYNSIAELNAEWEDYEEPEEFWFVDSGGEVEETTYLTEDDKSNLKNFGNYFSSKEEAEKAVEKLKAWKRLKDKGFKFIGVRGIGKVIDFDIPEPYNRVGFDKYNPSEDEKEFYDDLLFLFGGE